jgi:hypothetical protein
MGVETSPEYPDDLRADWPLSSDSRREGDDHLRNIKTVIRNVCKNADGVVIGTPLMQAVYPGGMIIVALEGADPNNIAGPTAIGGEWQRIGTLTNTNPAGAGGPTLSVWQLVEAPAWET